MKTRLPTQTSRGHEPHFVKTFSVFREISSALSSFTGVLTSERVRLLPGCRSCLGNVCDLKFKYYIYILKCYLRQSECGESIDLTGTLSELNVIQGDVTSVASTPCTFKDDLKRGNSKIRLSVWNAYRNVFTLKLWLELEMKVLIFKIYTAWRPALFASLTKNTTLQIILSLSITYFGWKIVLELFFLPFF